VIGGALVAVFSMIMMVVAMLTVFSVLRSVLVEITGKGVEIKEFKIEPEYSWFHWVKIKARCLTRKCYFAVANMSDKKAIVAFYEPIDPMGVKWWDFEGEIYEEIPIAPATDAVGGIPYTVEIGWCRDLKCHNRVPQEKKSDKLWEVYST